MTPNLVFPVLLLLCLPISSRHVTVIQFIRHKLLADLFRAAAGWRLSIWVKNGDVVHIAFVWRLLFYVGPGLRVYQHHLVDSRDDVIVFFTRQF